MLSVFGSCPWEVTWAGPFPLFPQEKQPQRPWPKDRIWSFENSPKIFGSPMLDAVLHKSPLDKDVLHWLKHRPPIFQAMWDRWTYCPHFVKSRLFINPLSWVILQFSVHRPPPMREMVIILEATYPVLLFLHSCVQFFLLFFRVHFCNLQFIIGGSAVFFFSCPPKFMGKR